ncbi:ABC transporter permease [Pantoea sp. CCBC3-3-1]|uniref:ABC transporter permease n=1 Tax=Pantoea sp. CCBC3-3-1 TaxID=2490851 RepID=UPI0011BD554B|nr:ABC transporter permease [Pantoea sp. CCBC3-3-1]
MNLQPSNQGHQLAVLLRIGLRNLWRRPLYLAAILTSFIFLSVIVTSLFSLREGLISALESSAEPGLYFAQSKDSSAELTSTITRTQAAQLSRLPGVIALSPEWVVLARLSPDNTEKEYLVRGVTPAAFTLLNANSLPLLRLTSGRLFQPGQNELLVGASLAQHYPAFRPGATIRLHEREWKIVGEFSTGGSPRQSEFLADLEHIRTSWGAGLDYNLVAFTGSASDAREYQQAMAGSLSDRVTISDSRTHYAGGSEGLSQMLLGFGLLFSLLAAISVTAGIIALCESLIANQQDQLAMLLLLGYGRIIGASYLCQIVLPGLAGALAGSLLSMLLFNGITFTTFDHARELVFPLVVSVRIQIISVAYGVLVSFIASLFVLRAISAATKGK